MKNFITGIIFSLLLLICFTLLRNGIGLWIAFVLSLVITTFVFAFYIKKKKASRKETRFISIGTGVFYIIFASIGIALFPAEQIRDLGDIVMPYFNAFIFGVCTIIVFIYSGMTINK
jgi:O-antigen/teichoic acid export membrane protein